MLEKPNLKDSLIVSVLRDAYGLDITQVNFLALGNDANSAAYQAIATDGTRYFIKLRKGGFELVHQSVVVHPHWYIRADSDGRWATTMTLAIDTSMAEKRPSYAEAAATV